MTAILNYREKLSKKRSVFCLVLASCLALAAATPAKADVTYDFSIAANGTVGAIDIKLTEPAAFASGVLTVPFLNEPNVTVTYGAGIDAAISVVGIEQTNEGLLWGLNIYDAGDHRLYYTQNYPGDFFVFANATPGASGTFLSSSGNVISFYTLDAGNPNATLKVSNSAATTPEPSSLLLLGTGLVGTIGAARRRFNV